MTTGQAPRESGSSATQIHVMLNKAMADDYRNGTARAERGRAGRRPALKARRRDEIKVWDADQLVDFLDAIRKHQFHPVFHLRAHTGLRRGELLGLRWSELDLVAGSLPIRQALVSVGATCISRT